MRWLVFRFFLSRLKGALGMVMSVAFRTPVQRMTQKGLLATRCHHGNPQYQRM
jgi:hypothetical protein